MNSETKKSGFVAIAGRPNAGKSTLLNRVLGVKVSIVTPKAQTTRERVLGIHTTTQGQIVFIDTPGIHRAKVGGINAFMVNEAKEALDGPSAVWYLVDPSSAVEFEAPVLELLKGCGAPVFLILNKADVMRIPRERFEKLGADVLAAGKAMGIDFRGPVEISAWKGTGVKELEAETWKLIEEGPLYYPDEEQVSDRPTKFFVGEKVREQLLMQLGDEVPYCCAVEIERFDEKVSPPRIEAIIHVERESQKGMVVGKGGTKIKAIGQAAREEIEEFLGHKVFLGLRVKLLKDWSKDAETLKRLGYQLPKEKKKDRKNG